MVSIWLCASFIFCLANGSELKDSGANDDIENAVAAVVAKQTTEILSEISKLRDANKGFAKDLGSLKESLA